MSLKSRLLFYFQRSRVTENSQLNILKTLTPPTEHDVEKLKQELKNKIKRSHYFFGLLCLLEAITGWVYFQKKFKLLFYYNR